MKTPRSLRFPALACFAALLFAGCAAPPAPTTSRRLPPSRRPRRRPRHRPRLPPVPPAAFADAVARAGEQLLRDAQAAVGSGPRELIIDPLIDASTGQQTASTVQMGQQMTSLIKTRVPQWNVRQLSRASLSAGRCS